MEEETITPHPDYIKGFNEGYILSKHMPELSEQLSKGEGASDRLTGIKDGRQQYLLEQTKDRYPEYLSDNRISEGPAAEKEKPKDKGMEPER